MEESRYKNIYSELKPKLVAETYFDKSRSAHAPNRKKSRGLADPWVQFRPTTEAKSTPYRLPLLGWSETLEEPEYKVWSRHGYECHSQKPIDMTAIISEKHMTPWETSQQLRHLRQLELMHPKFHSAMISPALRQPHHQAASGKRYQEAERISVPEDSLFDEDAEDETLLLQQPGRLTSVDQSARNIHWDLTSLRKLAFDKKTHCHAHVQGHVQAQGHVPGRGHVPTVGHVQGPYSREFTVTCSAPRSWMRMKWGRSKATLV